MFSSVRFERKVYAMFYTSRLNSTHRRGLRPSPGGIFAAVVMAALVMTSATGFVTGSPVTTVPPAAMRSMKLTSSATPTEYFVARLQWEIASRTLSYRVSSHLLNAANDLNQAVIDSGPANTAGYETAANELHQLAVLPETSSTPAQNAEGSYLISELNQFFDTPGLFSGRYSPDRVAFQANTGNLWKAGYITGTNLDDGLAPGTSPSITAVDGGYEIAFQANTGDLWVIGALGDTAWNLGMMSGTSPSITTTDGGSGYEVAVQTNTGNLWTIGSLGDTAWNLGMMSGTSPSITTFEGGVGYEVAVQANTGNLWTIGSYHDTSYLNGFGMMSGTSPSIAAM